MKGIKSIIYESNGQTLIIDVEIGQIKYNDILGVINEEKTLEYLKNLFGIIDSWNKEYINTKMIDGSTWKLTINYSSGNKKEYSGKSSYPNNFEAFERLNYKLLDEVQNG